MEFETEIKNGSNGKPPTCKHGQPVDLAENPLDGCQRCLDEAMPPQRPTPIAPGETIHITKAEGGFVVYYVGQRPPALNANSSAEPRVSVTAVRCGYAQLMQLLRDLWGEQRIDMDRWG